MNNFLLFLSVNGIYDFIKPLLMDFIKDYFKHIISYRKKGISDYSIKKLYAAVKYFSNYILDYITELEEYIILFKSSSKTEVDRSKLIKLENSISSVLRSLDRINMSVKCLEPDLEIYDDNINKLIHACCFRECCIVEDSLKILIKNSNNIVIGYSDFTDQSRKAHQNDINELEKCLYDAKRNYKSVNKLMQLIKIFIRINFPLASR